MSKFRIFLFFIFVFLLFCNNVYAAECNALLTYEAAELIAEVVNIVRIAVPILLIILCSTDFVSIVTGQDEKVVKVATGRIIKRFIAAAAFFFVPLIVSFILGLDYKNSFKIYKRDKNNHSSPNSAHPEAAVAGALNVQLGGANYYFGKLVEKPTIGDDIEKIDVDKVNKTNNILYCSAILGCAMALIINGIISNIIF